MAYERRMINGYRAEILKDYGKSVAVTSRQSGAWNYKRYDVVPDRVNPAWLKGAIAFAELHGCERITITHSLYARYSLRTVMKSVGGTYTIFIDYTRNEAGKWKRTRKIKNEMY